MKKKIIYPDKFICKKARPNAYGNYPKGEIVFVQNTKQGYLEVGPIFVSGYRQAIKDIQYLNREIIRK